MENEMKNLYKKVVADIDLLEDYIYENENNSDFSIQNTVSIKRRQVKAMLELKKSLSNALWERYDDNNM